MIEKLNSKELTKLFEGILKLKTTEECYKFFEDLCTIKELEAMSTRFQAAIKLLDGKTFEEILDTVSISSATLSRVSKAIKYGDGGYQMIIRR